MDNTFLILILFMMMGGKSANKASGVNTLSNFINTMEVDHKYTAEKIRMVKKVGPYFPENYLPLISKSISFAEKFIKLNEVVDFMKTDDEKYILEHIPVDSKDRMNKILSTIKRESPKSRTETSGTIMDLILNMDRYQKMFGVLSKVMGNPDSLNDPSQLMNLVVPLMGGEEKESKDKLKEMSKMMEMLKLLDTPKKGLPTKIS